MSDVHSCSYDCVRPDCVRRARENLHYAQSLLRDWQEFVSTVKISYDAQVGYEAGSIRLDSLKARTQEVLKP